MGKRNEVTAQTRQNMMDAFWQLYCENRIEKITVKDITSKAGYNRSTFYEYFKDPYDVLEQLEAAIIPDLNGLPPIKGTTFTMGLPMDTFMLVYEKNRNYYSVLLGDKGDPAFSTKLKNVLKPILIEVVKTKTNYDTVKLDYVLEYALTAMIGIMSYWFAQPNKLPETELHDLMSQLMEKGVLSVLENVER